MQRRALGETGMEVSAICLGTMMYGEQNTQAEAHQQLDHALDCGVNFIDTAEMYAVPPCAETQGRSEEHIGTWLASPHVARDQVIVGTKVSGPGEVMRHLRGGPRLNAHHIQRAVDASLQRLQTDYIDLYQVHWPERNANFFGKLGYSGGDDGDAIPIEETCQALLDLVTAGKVRAIGISNETPWGMAEYLRLARERDIPRIASIQNPYNLLNRSFEIGLAEMAMRERCGLLAYSPLGFGTLSGKYLDDVPEGSRLHRWNRFTRYSGQQTADATAQYVALARQHGLAPAQMALAFVLQQPFVTSVIIGATTMAQLEENLQSAELALSPELLDGIEAIHTAQPNPAP